MAHYFVKSSTHPYPDKSNLARPVKGDVDEVVLALGEGREPHVDVVTSTVIPVNQVLHHARVLVVLWEDVDVTWVSPDLTHNTNHVFVICFQNTIILHILASSNIINRFLTILFSNSFSVTLFIGKL